MYELKAQTQEFDIPGWMDPVFDTGAGQVCSTLIEVILFFNIQ